MTYRIDWNVNEMDATNVTLSATLPAATPEAQWVEVPEGCDVALSSITNNDQTLTCVIGDRHEGSFGTVFPTANIDGTRSGIDGEVIPLTAGIATDQSGPVSSEEVSLTISAAPLYDWTKGRAHQYYDIENEAGENGYVLAWAIQLKGAGSSNKGLAPLDDNIPIQFFDHLFWFSSNGDPIVDATLITAANLAGFTGNFDNRVCGGYSGLLKEQFWDYTDTLFRSEGLPFGVNGLGTVDNTTFGAQAGTESIVCTDVTAGNTYPIIQMDITGHDTTGAAPKSNQGSGSNGALITAQVVFWFPETELFPGTGAGNVHIHNVISGTDTVIPAPAGAADVPSEYGDPIAVAGSATGFETESGDNGPHSTIRRTPSTPGPSAYRHWVMLHNGPYEEMRLYDPNTGMPSASINTRRKDNGGLGQNGTYLFDGSVTAAAGNLDVPWGFNGEVSRNQYVTVEMGVGTFHNTDYSISTRNQIHGCLYVDNEFMDIVPVPATFPVTQVATHYEHYGATANPPLGADPDGSPSHGLVHVLYGDAARAYARSWAVAEPVRLNPAFTPDFVVEVATAAVNVGTDYERGEVQCNDADAATGWTQVDTLADAAAFDADGDGRYEGIELVRVRTIDPVAWNAPFPMVWHNRNDSNTNANPSYGSAFRLYVQGQVKPDIASAPNTSQIYVHAARSRGEWDGTGAPTNAENCTRGATAGFETFEANTSGWCNLATLPIVGNADESDPIERVSNNYNTLSHRDTTTVVGPRLGLSKTNAAGNSDIVLNGDLVTFNLNLSVTGSPTPVDAVQNITVTDVLPAHYEFVSLTQPTDGTCTGGSTISCGFGDRIAPWSDSFTITVRVKGATANKALANSASVTGEVGEELIGINAQSSAYSFTPGPFHESRIVKQVPDLNGPCVHEPGLTPYGAGSDDCSWTDIEDNLEYTLEYKNAGMADLDNFRIIDVLPHAADENEAQTTFVGTPAAPAGTTGDGRQPESDFNGTTALISVTSSMGGTIYYTMADPATVVRDPDHPSNATGFPNGATIWCSAFGGTGCPATIADATAFYVDLGTLAIADEETIDVVIGTTANLHDDIYTNTFGARTDDILVQGRSNDVSIMVEQYDLAIVKALASGQPSAIAAGGTIDYVITIENQGTVTSGEFTVDDMIPAGLSYVSASPAPDGTVAAGDTGLLTWTFTGATALAAGAQQQITLTLQLDDPTQSPFRNWVEIASDSGDDEDSQPGDNNGNDDGPGDGGLGGDDAVNHNDVTDDEPKDDEDDSDYEDVFFLVYDLALVKTLVSATPTPVTLGSQVTYMVTVMNQGNVPSGSYTVADTIPAGMSFVSASGGGASAGGSVTWVVPATSELAPGAIATFTVTTQVDDVAQQPFRNNAEIIADSGDDKDSDPTDGSGATDMFDDQDVSNDEDPGDSDDSDFVSLGALVEYDLALIKAGTSISPLPAAVGSQVTHTITVMNQGNVPSGTYTVDDLIPAGMGFVSATPAATTAPAAGTDGVAQWVVSAANELPVGGQATFTIVTEILDASEAPFRNNAEITADSGDDSDSDPGDGSGTSDTFDDNDVTNDEDPNDSDDSDFDEISLEPEYDLALVKNRISVVPTPAAIGAQVTYEIVVMNQGDLPSGTYTISDLLPAGLTFVSASPTATADPGTGASGAVTWVVPATSELAAGAQATFTLVAEIAAGATSPLRNGAEITADSGDDDDSDPTDGSGATDSIDDTDVTTDEDAGDEDDSDFDELLLDGVYDLALIKELQNVSPSPAAIGSLVTYQITVQNQGGQPSGSYTVDDVIPAGMVFASAQPAATTDPGVDANGTVQWVVPASNELAPGEQAVFTLIVKIDDASGSPFRNTGEITADSGDDVDSDPTDGSGGTDTFDDHDATDDADDGSGDADDSDFAELAMGDSYDLALIKTATSVVPSPANHGSLVTYEITVMNQGTMTSGAFQVTDVLPAGMTFQSASSLIGGAVITDPGVDMNGNVVFDVLLADELAAGTQTTFTVVAKIEDVLAAPFRNTAEISEDSGADEDSDPSDGSGGTDVNDDTDVTNDNDPEDSDDSDFDLLEVAPVYDLAMIKAFTSADPAPADLGSAITYTITVMNQGNVPSGIFQVTDTIPAGMSFVSASAVPVGTVITDPGVGAGGSITFDVPLVSSLDVGETTTFEVVLKVEDILSGPFRNGAEITEDSGDDADSDPTDGSGAGDTLDDTDVTSDVDPSTDSDDSDFDLLNIPIDYDLALDKRMAAGAPIDLSLGGVNSFEIEVENEGNVASGTFSVSDMLPAGLSYVSATPAADAPAAAGTTGLLTWTIPATAELAPGAKMTITLTVKVDDPSQAGFRNWAEIETDSSGDIGVTDSDSEPGDNDGNDDGPGEGDPGGDPEAEDDSDSEDLRVVYDLAMVKTLSPGQTPWIDVGSVVSYDVVVKNQGNVPSAPFTVTDTLPAGTSYVASSGPGFACAHDGAASGGIATCTYTPPTAADLAPGATVILQLQLQIDDLTQATYTNWAEISDDSADDVYGTTDEDSQPGDHNAVDSGPGDSSTGGDPSIDHDDIDHAASGYDDAAEDEDDSDPATIYATSSTPVTLESFQAVVGESGSASVWFATSTEEANIGFNLYGRKGAGKPWKRLNDALILAKEFGDQGGSYTLAVDANGSKQFALSDVDVRGRETPHGPFKANRLFGRDPSDPDEAEVETADEVVSHKHGDDIIASSRVGHIKVTRSGVQRVSVKTLTKAGILLNGADVESLAMTFFDRPVPIWIGTKYGAEKISGKLTKTDVIEFVAVEHDTMYRNHAIYRLFEDVSQAKRVLSRKSGATSAPTSTLMRTTTWAPDVVYGRTSPLSDAWYAKRLTALQSVAQMQAKLSTPNVVADGNATITVTVWGANDDVNVDEDHHVRVYVNDNPVAEERFDGMVGRVITAKVPANTLIGNNSIQIEAINDGGAGVSSVAVESIEIEYPAAANLNDGRLAFSGSGSSYSFVETNDTPVAVWSVGEAGVTRTISDASGFDAATGNPMYYAATVGGMFNPIAKPARAMGDLASGEAEYLIISHRKFNNGDLQRLADVRRGEGLTVKTVNVDWIYEANSSGNVSAGAVHDYIAWAHENLGTRFVLLVGGDTYDYKGLLGNNRAKSMIPTLYGPSAEGVNHAPVDPMYGDVDGDGVPEVAIGRFPVETKSELRLLVDKTLAYAQVEYGNRAMFVTDNVDDATQRSFTRDGERMRDLMPENWKSTVVSLDKLDRKRARDKIKRRVQKGVALTTWIGHSDQSVWSFDRVLRNKDVRKLENFGKPTVVTQFGCWNTYYVEPSRKSMAHSWLLEGEQGAAAVMGASTITDATAEQLLADALFDYLIRGGLTFGEAMVKAKRDMAAQYPMERVEDILSGYLLLGDPAMKLPQVDVQQ